MEPTVNHTTKAVAYGLGLLCYAARSRQGVVYRGFAIASSQQQYISVTAATTSRL